jgi:starch synthase (maltosyl-transferring)
VNLDPHHVQAGWTALDLAALGLDPAQPYQVHDLLTDACFIWQGARNYVKLDPHTNPAHIFRVRRRVRTEQQFEYYM